MGLIRRHLGAWSIAWLSCQAATFLVLLPTMSPFAGLFGTGTTLCVEAPSADECPMHTADGDACPMHSGTANADQAAKDDCAMRATTSGPMMALASMFAMPGVLVAASPVSMDAGVSVLSVLTTAVPGAFSSLDSPPPRS